MPQLIFSPAEIQELTEWTPDAQRDLRHKGFLSNYGFQTKGGRWKYTTRDLVAFGMAMHLREAGLPIQQVMGTSWTQANQVMNIIHQKDLYSGNRFVAFLFRVTLMDDRMTMYGWDVIEIRSVAELDATKPFSKADLIDLKTVAGAAPDKVKSYVITELDNA